MTAFNIASIVVGIITIGVIVVGCYALDRKDKAKERLMEVLTALAKYVEEAERLFGSGKGSAKLEYVIAKVQMECIEKHVKLSIDAIKDHIEQILSTPHKKQIQPQPIQPNAPQNLGNTKPF